MAELIYRPDMYVPPDIEESLVRYWRDGIPTGDFLRAVLENDLMMAAARADTWNQPLLSDIALFVRDNLPVASYGSPERVAKWVAIKAEERRHARSKESR